MRLVYKDTGEEVKVGDVITREDRRQYQVVYFREPHKSSSSGKVTVRAPDEGSHSGGMEYFVSIIGAHWIEREDQGWVDPDYDPTPYCAWCNAMDPKDCDCGPIAENH